MAGGQGQRPRSGARRGPHRGVNPLQPPSVLSSLQSFLLHTAPTLPIYSDPDSPSSSSTSFTLADLWQSYEAWSAYGCEVPLRINVDGVWQEVIQCYTPHLAGIQLFAADPRYGADHSRRIPTSTSSAAASGYCSEEEEGAEAAAADSSALSDTCSSAYTCSTASTASTASDSEDGDEACCKGSPLAGSGAPVGLRRLAAASAAVASASARGSVLQKQQPLGEPSVPLFEYMEGERPHLRLPLHDQILELAERCPELLTLDTRDLHPTSWLAVTWVPIYRIPSVPDPTASRDLQANFLTFHSLTVPAPRTHAAPADLCSIAPLPPLLDPIGAAAVAWRTEVARQQLLAAALQQFAAAQQAAAAASSTPAAGDASIPASQPASPSGSESTASTPVAALAARMAAASLECGGGGAAAPSVALRPQLPLAATCLRPFAFMPYKASGRTWVDDWNLQRQHLPMIAAAGSWVERRKVALPDFDFFSHMYRPLPTGFSSGFQR